MDECPPIGTEVIGWKKLCSGRIAKVLIGKGVPRVHPRPDHSPDNRKCRAESVEVVQIYESNGRISTVKRASGLYNSSTRYRVGGVTHADSYDPSEHNVCLNGIHFFLTRAEAKAWQ